MGTRRKCPKCGCEAFFVTAHVTQDWKVDTYGTFLEAIDECVEVTHFPDDDDIWDCAGCTFSAPGREFVVHDKDKKEKEYEK